MDVDSSPPVRHDTELPSWPVMIMPLGVPICWVLGLGELTWAFTAAPMALLLAARWHRVRVPPMFALWLLFLAWTAIAVVGIDSVPRLVGFAVRALLYLAATVTFVYVYNLAPASDPIRTLARSMTYLWVVVVVGGYLGVLFPGLTLTTPMAYLLPGSITSNEVVREMVYPSTTQGNPEGYFDLALRPSAPFLYTNNWGNAYSVLLPFVLVFLERSRRDRAWTFVAVLLPLSVVPALLTLNRGMFVALGLGMAYAAVRLLSRGYTRALAALTTLAVVVLVLSQLVPVASLLDQRLSEGASNESRLNVYAATWERTLDSPVLGYGAPRTVQIGAPALGTQGQFWMVLFSSGIPGATLFVAWFAWATLRSFPAPDTSRTWLHVVIAMTTLEIFYYGILGPGLVIAMVAIALVTRPAPGLPARHGSVERRPRL